MPPANALCTKPITRIKNGTVRESCDDPVAVEEPLEIRVNGRSLAVVMRTPGHDRELAAGFLVTEGVVHRRDDVLDIVRCTGDAEPIARAAAPGVSTAGGSAAGVAGGAAARDNVVDVILAPGAAVDWARLTRHVFTSSSCGICSRASIEAVRTQLPPISAPLHPGWSVVAGLPDQLRVAQAVFAATGGLHASALFSADGHVEVVREDVGRHNALDKVVGRAFFAEQLPLAGRILLVSGRVSFEIMQKALAAGIPCVAAISAPTSAAVEFAQAAGQTLVGFLRGDRMNVYAGTLTP
jgi:FdhD protein